MKSILFIWAYNAVNLTKKSKNFQLQKKRILLSNFSKGVISAIGGWPISEEEHVEENFDLLGTADWTKKKVCSCER